MHQFGEAFRFIHVVFGVIGLVAFWIPVFARKGGVNHVRAGKVFVWSAYVLLVFAALALLTRSYALLSQGIGPAEEPARFAAMIFLGYLTLITFVIVHYGMQVLRSKHDPTALKNTTNVALAYAGIAASLIVIAYALLVAPPNKILLLALSPIGLTNGYAQLRYMAQPAPSKRAWMYEHLGAMLGGGIAFHTAFAVFGSTRLFDIGLTGWVAIIPWIAPAIIGIPAITIWTRHYRRKFGELA